MHGLVNVKLVTYSLSEQNTVRNN